MDNHAFTNNLINESSPYLLQHAHNPVDWNPWKEEVLAKAKKEEKLLLISVGYAACHWCHVMEHESFEDSTVAAIMNQNFVNIKVDREERPDVDQVYMDAVQLMTGSGGWPMNVIALPDGRPVWGGTYFPKGEWMQALEQVQKVYKEDPEKLHEYAEKLAEGIKNADFVAINTDKIRFTTDTIQEAVKNWSASFDLEKGGTKRVPKFMMPNNYQFLLRYAHQQKDKQLSEFVMTTLDKISYGGVYDHLGGGFSRYATDDKWHIPHFEKMLYDNAQLVSLYSDAYLVSGDKWYKQVVYETLQFAERELSNGKGIFYSALDADSTTPEGELEEGAFYVWTKSELQELLKEEYDLFASYYNINPYGKWEKDLYVLIRKEALSDFCTKNNLSVAEMEKNLKRWKRMLLPVRNKRTRPRLDDKSLTSWNALMLKGYADAYRVFGDPEFLSIARKTAAFIKNKQLKEDGSLFHNYKDGKNSINGYLEDYAAVVQAYLALYENTLNMEWLQHAKSLTDYTITHFYSPERNLFYFTSDLDPALVTRKVEFSDNVIPASNSIMAKNLFLLSHHFDNRKYLEISQSMLHTVQPQITSYGPGYSNWLDLMLNYSEKFYEVVAVGVEAKEKIKKLNRVYYPNKLIAGSTKESDAPLLENRFDSNQTLIYVCVDNACKYPVDSAKKALELLE